MRLFLSIFIFFAMPFCLNPQKVSEWSVSPKVVEERIKILDALTPMELVYNADVQAYIDVYTIRRRDHLARILGQSELYFPLFEEHLDRLGLPLELKYLAVVESALDPLAQSKSGAIGLWQFLFQAARMVNLQVTSYVDERRDPVKSTEAAARYLKYLYDNFHNWNLALASYNGGIASVNEALFKAGGPTDFWEIRQHLSAETRNYVPAFIAVVYVMTHYKSYGIQPIPPQYNYDDLDLIFLEKSASFTQLGRLLDLKPEILQMLNPVYLRDFVPVVSTPVRLLIPKEKTELYSKKRAELKEEGGPPLSLLPPIGDTRGRIKKLHRVAPGEFFHTIAMRYACRVEDLQKWNGLKSRNLMAGQSLIIWYRPPANQFFFIHQELILGMDNASNNSF
jgi:membrane-bound lytic murein transglycosylase D